MRGWLFIPIASQAATGGEGSGGGGRGCRQQECCRQAYREVFTASPARRLPARDSENAQLLGINTANHRGSPGQ